nr:signal peptidase I [Cryobacterium roopkundense]
MSGSKKSLASFLSSTLLNLAAIGGVLCIIGVLAAVFFNVTLIMFKTGSMSPAITAGSVALVREIPASEIAVGDVVTVDRSGQLPITHRVTSVSAGATGEWRSITMQGDANPVADPQPYDVAQVRLVVFSVPYLAQWIVNVSNPFVLGGITVAAAALVAWAFWPRDDENDPVNGPHEPGGSREPVAPRAVGAHTAALWIVPLGVALSVLGAPVPASAATPTPVPVDTPPVQETVVTGDVLSLTSIGRPAEMGSLTPGRVVEWQVGIQPMREVTGTVRVGISAEGNLAMPGKLQLSVLSCRVQWVDGACARGESLWLPTQDLAAAVTADGAGTIRPLQTIPAEAARWLLLQVTMPAESGATGTAEVRIHAEGQGEEGQDDEGLVSDAGAGTLARTGFALAHTLVLALAAVGSGLAAAGLARLGRRKART